MLQEQINNYLNGFSKNKDPFLLSLEQSSRERHIPIIQSQTLQLLLLLLRIHQPRRILEIGGAEGYSAIHMANTLKDCHITTVEIDEERFNNAQANIASNQLNQRITALHYDAALEEPIHRLGADYQCDLLFFDAAKGQYLKFFKFYFPFLKKGGLLISDNVLMDGLVTFERVAHKHRAMVTKLKAYNELITEHPELTTSIVPIGDGLAISYRA